MSVYSSEYETYNTPRQCLHYTLPSNYNQANHTVPGPRIGTILIGKQVVHEDQRLRLTLFSRPGPRRFYRWLGGDCIPGMVAMIILYSRRLLSLPEVYTRQSSYTIDRCPRATLL